MIYNFVVCPIGQTTFLCFYQNWKIGVRIGSLVHTAPGQIQILYNISDTVVMSV